MRRYIKKGIHAAGNAVIGQIELADQNNIPWWTKDMEKLIEEEKTSI